MADEITNTEEKKKYNLYDSGLVDRVGAAEEALTQMNAARPEAYQNKYQGQIDVAMDKLLNRQDFKYDVNQDMLYQQIKDQMSRQGKMAMQDTIGQAAALTGGYGSTYGQRVGQQVYDEYMTRAQDRIPELAQLAQAQYDRQYGYDKDALGILQNAEGQDYNRWGDNYTIWNNDRNYAAGRYDTELGQAMTASEQMYNRLQALIAMGYTPTEEQMALAGMDANELLALQGKLKVSSGGSSRNKSGGSGRPKGEDGDYSLDAGMALERVQNASDVVNKLVAAGASEKSAKDSVAKAEKILRTIPIVTRKPR